MKKLMMSIALGLVVTCQVNAQVSVGWDGSCDYDVSVNANGLQQAIDDGATEIRLSNENFHQTAIEITNNVIMKGGYADCTAANSDLQSNINSVIDATGVGLPVVKIRTITNAQVILDSLTLQKGTGFNSGYSSDWAGGLSIDGVTGVVNLNHINLRDNEGIRGGGLAVINFNATGSLLVTANNLAIQNNTASLGGGGLYCYAFENGFDLQIDLGSASTIRNNHSDDHGGGVYADQCSIEFNAGESSFINSNIDKEIFANSSNFSGGGIFAVSGAVITLNGTSTASFDIFLNEGNLDTSASGEGGGVNASSQGTEVHLINTKVSNNKIGRYGGGLMATFDAVINMDRADNGCNYSEFCSQLIGNNNIGLYPGGGGAMAARYNGQINVKNTLIAYNNSEYDGYVLYSDPDGQVLLEGNLMVENGRHIDFDNYTAFYQNGDSVLTAAYNTITQNNDGTTLFRQHSATSELRLYGNIVKSFGNIHQGSSSITDINCNLINDDSSIEVPISNSIIGSADFIDAGSMDYRLAETDTLAIDICNAGIYLPGNDLQGKSRGVDHPAVVDGLGPYDLGAYEVDDNDLIFKNDFE
ncbi:MAG: hypothetical protein DWP95_03850 [Proteobacteria bacterium]|nr:MAG: hypothetical protein DWP95_03850 [Pseudomonadota bacterium]